MTAILGPAPLRVTQLRVVRSEWTKFRSLRSTTWTLLAAVVLMIGIGAIFSAVATGTSTSTGPGEKGAFDAVQTSLNGITFAQLAIGVLGVLLVSGEYGTGMIRSSLTVVPRRLPVLWGKLAVFTGVVLVVSTIASFASFFLGQALLDSKGLGVSITAAGALRSVVGAALYMTVAGTIGLAVGALLRNTAAAISVVVGVFFVIPPLAGLLPSSISDSVVPYLPSNAGGVIYGGGSGTDALSPWVGFGLLCAYAVVLIVVAAWRLLRTDA